jgi:hypothetical protein
MSDVKGLMLEFDGFHAVLCSVPLTQMSEFATVMES